MVNIPGHFGVVSWAVNTKRSVNSSYFWFLFGFLSCCSNIFIARIHGMQYELHCVIYFLCCVCIREKVSDCRWKSASLKALKASD